MKKKLVAGLLTGAMIAALLTGCAGSGSDKSSDAKESYTIGIEQFAEHGSLDNCREGFLQGLEEEGIKEGDNLKVETKNAAADMGTAGQISDSFVSDKVDLSVHCRHQVHKAHTTQQWMLEFRSFIQQLQIRLQQSLHQKMEPRQER